jgi:hypothetical protein
MLPHVALLGDSIFDNRAYTGGEPDVITHLRGLLPAGWQASLLAVDGSLTADLPSQLRKLPADVTHLVISMGGNDALLSSDLLNLPVSSTAEALEIFAERQEAFNTGYRVALEAALQRGLPTTVCTIYSGSFEPDAARRIRVALTLFNDVILRAAFTRSLPVIDLGLVCAEPADYANPIEPSGAGGRKIARMIVASLDPEGAPRLHARVHGRLPTTP